MSIQLNEAQSRFLATLEIVRRELVVFEYSAKKLFIQEINAAWVKKLDSDMQLAEVLKAFVSRLSRIQDTIGDKLIPRALLMLAETLGSNLDNLNRAERLSWLDDVNDWLDI